jgi:hypothetical protein
MSEIPELKCDISYDNIKKETDISFNYDIANSLKGKIFVNKEDNKLEMPKGHQYILIATQKKDQETEFAFASCQSGNINYNPLFTDTEIGKPFPKKKYTIIC